MLRSAVILGLAMALLGCAALYAQAAEEIYVPGIEIALEVRTPQGDLRSFQAPGSPPAYWTRGMPIVKGDRLTVTPLIATGGAELGQVKIRLDNQLLSEQTESPWRFEVDTANLTAGHHLVEVWAATTPPKSKHSTATATFLIVPNNDPMLLSLEEGAPEAGPPVTDDERLACSIHSRDAKAEKGIGETSLARVSAPTLFFVSAGPEVKEFFYTLSREGRLTYTSPKLPILTHILLEPQKQDGDGQAAGDLILTVRAGDGKGLFGPPVWITVRIAPSEKVK
jgi:hypothetical protein